MSTIEIPETNIRRWTGPYLGNYYGNMWRTFNVDLENSPGHITLSRSLVPVADTTDSDLTNLGVIDHFIRTDAGTAGEERWFALSRSGRMFTTDSLTPLLLSATWNEDTLDSSPVDARDMTIHENDSLNDSGENQLFVTKNTDIAVLNDSATNAWDNAWWTSTQSQVALISGVPHPIEYFPKRRISLVGDGNFIHTIDKDKAISYKRLTLPFYYQVESIFTTTYNAYILCSGKNGRNGVIVEWNGSSETYNNIYDAQAIYPLAGVNNNEIPIIINSRGLVLEFNGNGFSQMVRNGQKIAFPSYEEIANSFDLATSALAIAPRGMTRTDDGLIYINAQDPGIDSQRQLGGIWCLNPETGNFYNKYSMGHGGTGDTDYGHQIISAPGALQAINSGAAPGGSSYLVTGGEVEMVGVGSSQNRIWHLSRNASSTVRRGSFITQYFATTNIQEMWDTLWIKFGAFTATGSQVIAKARGVNPLLDSNKNPIQLTITWASGTTFTVTLGASDDALAVGDEVEIMGGVNAGTLAHITAISGDHASLQTITIDETVITTSGTSYGRFDRWKKLGIINDTTKYFTPLTIGIHSSFIQFKIELRGRSTEHNIKSLVASLEKQVSNKK